SITVLKNNSLLPLERFGREKILNVIVADAENYRTEIHRPSTPWPNEAVGDYFTAQFRKRYLNVQTVKVDPSGNALDFESILEKAKQCDEVLCPIFSKARTGSGQFGLPPEIITFVNSLIDLQKPTLLVAMGSP